MKKLQLTSGGVYQVEDCTLTDKRVETHWSGPGIIVGKRAGADCRARSAYVIHLDYGGLFLISRRQFKVV